MAFVASPRQNFWDSTDDYEAWTEWVRVARHRAHEARPDRDSGTRRHRKPYAKLTRCLRRELPCCPRPARPTLTLKDELNDWSL